MKTWYMIGMLLFSLISHNALAEEDRARAFTQRYLTVEAPEGWKHEVADTGMFQNCVAYASPDESIIVAACPVSGEETSFADVRAEYEQEGNAVRLGDSVVAQVNGEGLLLLAPRKEGEGGAYIFVVPTGPEYHPMLHRACPMLAAFKNLAVPEELLVPASDPIRYTGGFSYQKSIPVPEWDGITLMREYGKDENGRERFIRASIIPHFPLWADMPQRLVSAFGIMKPEGRHWIPDPCMDVPEDMFMRVAKSRDGRALVILSGIAQGDAATWQECMDMLDDFVW